ncbi:protein Vpf81 [Vibrio fortis]|uniref:Protein Vpf81 n=1 Tax=Vibrio fortis TaxID=212667 RepID=A0A066UIG9_9VIBR|nr:hypothetical protein [Vibrio fortis]KDN27176.1 protein Vpf81 [Vibrio fortis]
MIKLRQIVSNKSLVAAVALTSGSAFAADPSAAETAINAAVASGKSMVGLTTSGVIGIAALGFGLGMVVSWLRK